MKRDNIYYKILLSLTVLSLLLFGCIREDIDGPVDNGEEIEVSIAFTADQMAELVKTRGKVVTDDARITSVDLLVYNYDENTGKETLAYHRKPIDITQNGDGTGTIRVRIAKSGQGEKYTFDVIANNATYVSNLLTRTMKINDDREVAQKELTTLGNPSISGSFYVPYWGYIGPTEIDTFTVFPEVKFISSLVKVDLGVRWPDDNSTGQGLPDFDLKQVLISNFAAGYYYIPHPDNVDPGLAKVTAPTLWSSLSSTTTSSRASNITDNFVADGVYFGEPDVNRRSSSGGRTFSIIIAGTNPELGTNDLRYYPIKLRDPNDPTEKLQYLRGHRYRINVVAINGDGYDELSDAASDADNIADYAVMYELSVHEEGDINHIVYNRTDYLGISKVSYDADPGGEACELKVKTNCAEGWDVAFTDENGNAPNWITGITTSAKSADVVGNVNFNVSDNSAGEPRIAYATFTTNTLSIRCTITQDGRWFISTDYTSPNIMNGDGDEYKVKVWGGAIPAGGVWVRAYSPDIVDIKYESDPGYKPDPTTAVSRDTIHFAGANELDLEILANAWIPMAMRQVQFQYTLTKPKLDDGTPVTVDWIPFEEGPQGKGHYTLKASGRTVALYDYKDEHGSREFTWSEAMGIEKVHDEDHGGDFYYKTFDINHYNFQFGNATHNLVTNNNRNALFYPTTEQTGCGDYEEPGYPKGGWRLPALEELKEMHNFMEHIGDLAQYDVDYWSSTDQHVTGGTYGGSYIVYLRPGLNFWYGAFIRNHLAHVRCVYEDPVIEVLEQTYRNWWWNPNNNGAPEP